MGRFKIYILLMMILATGFVYGETSWFVDGSLHAFLSANDSYRAAYGDITLGPEINGGLVLGEKIFVWSGLSLLANRGEIPVINETARFQQWNLSLGFGLRLPINKKMMLDLYEGFMLIYYREKALETENKDLVLGLKLGAKLRYYLNDKWYLLHAVAYTMARDREEDFNFSLGGIHISLGAGLEF